MTNCTITIYRYAFLSRKGLVDVLFNHKPTPAQIKHALKRHSKRNSAAADFDRELRLLETSPESRAQNLTPLSVWDVSPTDPWTNSQPDGTDITVVAIDEKHKNPAVQILHMRVQGNPAHVRIPDAQVLAVFAGHLPPLK